MSSFFASLNDKVKKAGADLAPKAVQLREQMNEKFQEVYGTGENSQLYVEDDELAETMKGLEAIRGSFKEIVTAVEHHYKALRKEADAEKALGEKLLLIASYDKFYSAEATKAHMAAGKSEISAGGALEKFASDMFTPLQELNRRFEDVYTKTVVPLKKRYETQKSDYLKYRGQLEKEEDEGKKSNLQALADAARPVWLDTSSQLKGEGDALAEAIASSLSSWIYKLVTLHRDALVFSSAAFAEASDAARHTGSG